MANQQKGVQQDTAVVVNDHNNMYPRPCLRISFFHVCIYDPFWVKNYIGTGYII